MGAVSFTKVEGLGNDFILLDRLDHAGEAIAQAVAWASRLAPVLCDRRTGVGADGILIVGSGAPTDTLATMIVINADGSRPEMCGNGLRCVAAFLAARFDKVQFRVHTDAGARDCAVVERHGNASHIRVDMGPARPLGKETPASGGARSFVGFSLGNPHAVCFVGADDDPEMLAREQGPAIEQDPVYQPHRTNVEFARVESGGITLWVWERGVGITQACGTGACASAAAAVAERLLPADHPIEVRLPGGSLQIVIPSEAGAGVQMTGPCRHVFSGVVWVDEA
jgi:diaminopimelate epimerase